MFNRVRGSKRMAWYFLAIVMGFIALRLIVFAISPRAIKVRPNGGRLPECPDSPNCVSSQAERADQKIDPIKYSGPMEEAKLRMRLVIDSMPGAKVLQEDRLFMHVEFQTLVFGFVDDVEFIMDDAHKVIHVRSASRLGYSDLGTNRRRVEKIRTLFDNTK
jgi:uncharacterized protein (DUF1499 family)